MAEIHRLTTTAVTTGEAAAQLSLRLFNVAQTLHNAPREIAEIAEDVSILSATLIVFSDTTQRNRDLCKPALFNHLRVLLRRFALVQRELEDHVLKGDSLTLQKIKWLSSKPKANTLLKKVQSIKSALSLGWTIVQLASEQIHGGAKPSRFRNVAESVVAATRQVVYNAKQPVKKGDDIEHWQRQNSGAEMQLFKANSLETATWLYDLVFNPNSPTADILAETTTSEPRQASVVDYNSDHQREDTGLSVEEATEEPIDEPTEDPVPVTSSSRASRHIPDEWEHQYAPNLVVDRLLASWTTLTSEQITSSGTKLPDDKWEEKLASIVAIENKNTKNEEEQQNRAQYRTRGRDGDETRHDDDDQVLEERVNRRRPPVPVRRNSQPSGNRVGFAPGEETIAPKPKPPTVRRPTVSRSEAVDCTETNCKYCGPNAVPNPRSDPLHPVRHQFVPRPSLSSKRPSRSTRSSLEPGPRTRTADTWQQDSSSPYDQSLPASQSSQYAPSSFVPPPYGQPWSSPYGSSPYNTSMPVQNDNSRERKLPSARTPSTVRQTQPIPAEARAPPAPPTPPAPPPPPPPPPPPVVSPQPSLQHVKEQQVIDRMEERLEQLQSLLERYGNTSNVPPVEHVQPQLQPQPQTQPQSHPLPSPLPPTYTTDSDEVDRKIAELEQLLIAQHKQQIENQNMNELIWRAEKRALDERESHRAQEFKDAAEREIAAAHAAKKAAQKALKFAKEESARRTQERAEAKIAEEKKKLEAMYQDIIKNYQKKLEEICKTQADSEEARKQHQPAANLPLRRTRISQGDRSIEVAEFTSSKLEPWFQPSQFVPTTVFEEELDVFNLSGRRQSQMGQIKDNSFNQRTSVGTPESVGARSIHSMTPAPPAQQVLLLPSSLDRRSPKISALQENLENHGVLTSFEDAQLESSLGTLAKAGASNDEQIRSTVLWEATAGGFGSDLLRTLRQRGWKPFYARTSSIGRTYFFGSQPIHVNFFSPEYKPQFEASMTPNPSERIMIGKDWIEEYALTELGFQYGLTNTGVYVLDSQLTTNDIESLIERSFLIRENDFRRTHRPLQLHYAGSVPTTTETDYASSVVSESTSATSVATSIAPGSLDYDSDGSETVSSSTTRTKSQANKDNNPFRKKQRDAQSDIISVADEARTPWSSTRSNVGSHKENKDEQTDWGAALFPDTFVSLI